MTPTLETSRLADWLENRIAEWGKQSEETENPLWAGKWHAALEMQEALVNGEFDVPGEHPPTAQEWKEGGRIALYFRDSETGSAVIGFANVFVDQEPDPISLGIGHHGIANYPLRPVDLKKARLDLRLEVDGCLPVNVSIPKGASSSGVVMTPKK